VDRQNFIDAIVDAPDDPAVWIAYADWLSEHGELRGEIINLALAADDHEDPERVRGRVRTLTWRLEDLVSPRLAAVAHCWRLNWWRGFIRGAELDEQDDAPPGEELVEILLADPHAALLESLDIENYWPPLLRRRREWLRLLRVWNLGAQTSSLERIAPRLEELELMASEERFLAPRMEHDRLRRLSGTDSFALCEGGFRLPSLEILGCDLRPGHPLLHMSSAILHRPPPSLRTLVITRSEPGVLVELTQCPVIGQLTRLQFDHVEDLSELVALCDHSGALAHLRELGMRVHITEGYLSIDEVRDLRQRFKRTFTNTKLAIDWFSLLSTRDALTFLDERQAKLDD
jgi:uncharacterized protein (TIGR02996 family)